MIRLALIAALLLGCAPSMAPPPHSVHGVPVEYRAAPYGDNGVAYWEDGVPVVGLHVAGLAPAHQWYVLAHEWCHLHGADSEVGADCCAGQYLARLGVPITDAALAVQQYHSGPRHPDGAVRAAVLISCYEAAL